MCRSEEICTAGDGTVEFQRTVLRLIEMQSADYIANRPRRYAELSRYRAGITLGAGEPIEYAAIAELPANSGDARKAGKP
jgi:AFG1-like ATPase